MKSSRHTIMRRALFFLLGLCVPVVNGLMDDFESDVLRRTELVVEGFVDTESCYSAMELSVANKEGDRRMDSESYVDFVKLYGPDGFLDDVEDFADLPLILQSNFNILACLCQQDAEDECCVGSRAGIETDGSFGDEIPTQSEKSYLFLVCSLTSVTIDRVIQSSAPSSSPTMTPEPTTGPTITPYPTILTPEPTPAPVETTNIEVMVTYNIGVNAGNTSADCEEGLVGAMNSLAPQVLAEVRRRRLRVSHRRLRSVQLDTSITGSENIECPDEVDENDTCEAVTASMTLLFQPTESDPQEVAATFQENLENAIFAGELQELLNCTEVYILDESILGTLPPAPTDRNISGGGIAAAVIGSLAIVAAVAFLINRSKEDKEELEELAAAPKDAPFDEGEDAKGSGEVKASSVVKAAGTLGAVKKEKQKVFDDDRDMHVVDTMSNPDDASSSNAGSSGWSSSAGISSMNTGSAEGMDLDKPGAVGGITSTLAALNERTATSDAPQQDEDTPSIPSVTRADLDAAIEQGDWAAVGATAALLAAASDSQSYSSRSEQYTGTRSQSGSSVSSIDAARAAELDHLVDAGDWEGVVLAAAKYEADEGKDSTPSESVSADSESRSNTDTAGQTADSSIGSSKALKRQEYRAIVEDLVQRVVPEEIQNVDEMMTQFRGREDELVETLRTMQERAVAQKARHSSQRAAKQQAKMASAAAKTETKSNVAKSRSMGTGQVSAQSTAKSLGTGKVEGASKSKSLGTGVIEESRKEGKHEKKQSALEAAIERGDWDAVEDAAAILSDNSMASSADTDEINRLADGISTDGSSAVGSTGQSDAADELEELIEAGDWTGVVQAASKSSAAKDTKKAAEEARRQRRLKHLQEEQEALAQAEIWTKIAEQSKDDSETAADRAAADATDWAISRSLNALVEAEQSGLNDASTDAGSVPRGKTNDEDDSDMEV